MAQKHVYFTGRVQGVGFRYTARSLALNYHVSGYVKNLADGRVGLVVRGDNEEIEAFIDELTMCMKENITNIIINDEPSDDSFEEFEIRF